MVRLKQFFTTTLTDYPIDCVWNPSDTCLAVALAGGEVFIKNLPGTESTWVAHKVGCTKIVWLDDVRFATAGQDGKLTIWNVNTGDLLGSFIINDQQPRAWVEHLVYSPQTQLLAVSAGKSLKIFDQNMVLCYHFSCHDSTISALSFSENGQKLAAAYYGGVNLYQFINNDYQLEVMPYPISFVSLAVSPNGRFVAAGTQDKRLHFWLLPYTKGEDLEMSGYPKKIEHLAWLPTSQYILTASQRLIIAWKMRSEKGSPEGSRPVMLDDHEAPVTQLITQKKGRLSVSGDVEGRIIIWDYPATEFVQTEWELNGSITTLAWSNDEKFLAATSENGVLNVWEVKQ